MHKEMTPESRQAFLELEKIAQKIASNPLKVKLLREAAAEMQPTPDSLDRLKDNSQPQIQRDVTQNSFVENTSGIPNSPSPSEPAEPMFRCGSLLLKLTGGPLHPLPSETTESSGTTPVPDNSPKTSD